MSDEPSMWDGAMTKKEIADYERKYFAEQVRIGADAFSSFYRRFWVFEEFRKLKSRVS